MGVLELIQQKAFVGKEFLTWMWFMSETERKLDIGKGRTVEIEMLGPIILDATYGDARVSTLRGDSPGTSPEAHTALLEGKKMKKAKLKFIRDDSEWTLSLDGENFTIGSMAVPNTGKLPFEDQMVLRLDMLMEFEELLSALLDRFLEQRLDARTWGKLVPRIQDWVRGK